MRELEGAQDPRCEEAAHKSGPLGGGRADSTARRLLFQGLGGARPSAAPAKRPRSVRFPASAPGRGGAEVVQPRGRGWQSGGTLVATLALLLLGASRAGAEVLRLRAAHMFDENHAWQKGFEKFQEVVRARSHGSLDVEIFNRGVLGTEKDYIQHLFRGDLDLTTVATASASGLAKEMTFLDLMFLWRDRSHWQRSLDGEVGQRIAGVIEKGTSKGPIPGFKVLGYWGGSERHILSRERGFTTLKDLVGFKIRIQESPVQQEMWALLGAVPVAIPLQDTSAAIQGRRVEGLENELGNAFALKFHEIAPFVSETAHILTVRPFLMSGQAWRKLTPDQQQVVVEAAKEATALARALEWKQAEEAIARMKSMGVHFYTFKDRQQMMDVTQAIRQRVAQEVGVSDVLEAIEREARVGKGPAALAAPVIPATPLPPPASAAPAFRAAATTLEVAKAQRSNIEGFDSSDVKVAKIPEFSARIEFEMTPASVKPGDSYVVRIYLVNESKKALKIVGVNATVYVNKSPAGGPMTPLIREVGPQLRALIDEIPGTWGPSVSSWHTEIVILVNKGDILKNQLIWR